MKYEVKTTVEIERKRLDDLMCGALEGGSTYWCDRCDIEWSDEAAAKNEIEYGHEAIAAGAEFTVWHNDEETTIPNGPKTIERALQQMADEHPFHFNNFINDNDDAETSDVFFQLLCFGELVYG